MKTIILLSSFFSIICLNNLKAQEIPSELLGEWVFEFELDACGNSVSRNDIQKLSFSPYNDIDNLDTVIISELSITGEFNYTRYQLELSQFGPDAILFSNLDATNVLDPFEFLTTYLSDSTTFIWTTTSVSSLAKNFKLISQDSLVFTWLTGCQACHCGAEIHFSRTSSVSSDSNLSDSNNWNIYPNPAKNYFSIKNSGWSPSSNVRLEIINSTGYIRKEFIISENNQIVYISDLPSGLYYLRIEDHDGITLKKLVLIN